MHPHFKVADIPARVPARGPTAALSPMPEPFLYVRLYDRLMATIAHVTGWVTWEPAPRPLQHATSLHRVKQLQKFRFTDLVVAGGEGGGEEEAHGGGGEEDSDHTPVKVDNVNPNFNKLASTRFLDAPKPALSTRFTK